MSAVQQQSSSNAAAAAATTSSAVKSSKGLAKNLEPFVCGGAAATFASVIIHPIDLAKVSQSRVFLSCRLVNLD
jgi:hypothetical protein